MACTQLTTDDRRLATVSQQRYLPFGEVRDISTQTGTPLVSETDFGYTGQRNYTSFGLMDYNARFYSPTLGRFTQPDSVIPSATNSQSWNRFAYVNNNPVNYNDPTGNVPVGEDDDVCLPSQDCWEDDGYGGGGGGGGGGGCKTCALLPQNDELPDILCMDTQAYFCSDGSIIFSSVSDYRLFRDELIFLSGDLSSQSFWLAVYAGTVGVLLVSASGIALGTAEALDLTILGLELGSGTIGTAAIGFHYDGMSGQVSQLQADIDWAFSLGYEQVGLAWTMGDDGHDITFNVDGFTNGQRTSISSLTMEFPSPSGLVLQSLSSIYDYHEDPWE